MKLSSLLLLSFLIFCVFALARPNAHADAISIDVEANKSVVIFAVGDLIYHAPCTPRAPVKSRHECDLTKNELLFNLNDKATYFLRGLNHLMNKPVALPPLSLGEVTILLKGESTSGKTDMALNDQLHTEQTRLLGLLQSYGEDKVTRAALVNTQTQIAQVKIRLGTDANYAQTRTDFENLIKEFLVPHITNPAEWESILASRNQGTLAGAFQQIMMKTDIENDMDFITVPPGTFTMGGTDSYQHAIYHSVTLTNAYDLQKTPVTQLQWYEVMGKDYDSSADRSQTNCPTTWTNFVGTSDMFCPQNPVDSLTYQSITGPNGFLERLNQQDNRYHYRLPTEAEYEFAIRGGPVLSKTNLAYYIGNDPGSFEDYEWIKSNANNSTHEVATRKPSPLGFYDLLGNVQEWVQDRWGDYTTLALVNPKGSLDSDEHVVRGAGIYGYSTSLASGYRYDGPASGSNIGFRLVRTAK
jgi:sulfatase modifying factor 1